MKVDVELLKSAQKGDRKAQYRLYRLCFPLLMGVCVRYRRDQQESVAATNAGFLKILNNLEKYPPEVPFEAWVRRIMINTLIDEFRREKKWRSQTVFSEHVDRQAIEEPIDFNDADLLFDVHELEAMVRRLPPTSQQAFNLFAIDGYSHAEVGQMLGMSEGTSKWHVNFARKQLQGWIRAKQKIEI